MTLSIPVRGKEGSSAIIPDRKPYAFYADPNNVRVVTEALGYLELELINKPKTVYASDFERQKDLLDVKAGKPNPRQHVIFVGYKSAEDFFERNRAEPITVFPAEAEDNTTNLTEIKDRAA